jgi:hypothetical protein
MVFFPDATSPKNSASSKTTIYAKPEEKKLEPILDISSMCIVSDIEVLTLSQVLENDQLILNQHRVMKIIYNLLCYVAFLNENDLSGVNLDPSKIMVTRYLEVNVDLMG